MYDVIAENNYSCNYMHVFSKYKYNVKAYAFKNECIMPCLNTLNVK